MDAEGIATIIKALPWHEILGAVLVLVGLKGHKMYKARKTAPKAPEKDPMEGLH